MFLGCMNLLVEVVATAIQVEADSDTPPHNVEEVEIHTYRGFRKQLTRPHSLGYAFRD